MRQGTVAAINRGMVAIATEDDGYTLIELLSEFEIQRGDLVAWHNDYGLGSENYRNITRGTTAEVYVQNHAVSGTQLPHQLLL